MEDSEAVVQTEVDRHRSFCGRNVYKAEMNIHRMIIECLFVTQSVFFMRLQEPVM